MRIIIPADGRVFEGTAVQIVQQMQSMAFGRGRNTISEYIDWLIEQTLRLEGIDLKIEGSTDREKAESLIRELTVSGDLSSIVSISFPVSIFYQHSP